MRVAFQFYHYDDLKPWLSRWSTFRLWFQSKVTGYVHVNVVRDGVVHELASWGGSLMPAHEYPFPASLVIELETSEKEFQAYLSNFREAALRRWPWLCHILALFSERWDNCASVTKSMVGYRASTPDRLRRVLDERGKRVYQSAASVNARQAGNRRG
jgi:hypothetical protein